jgi:uncharacterized protein YggT (Ycf19 family)
MNFILKYKEIINIISDITTIIAFIIAIFTLYRWKKEQKYSKQIDFLMDLEDKFVILIHSILIDFNWFSDMSKDMIDIKNKSDKDKNDLISFWEKRLEEYQNTNQLDNILFEYTLSLSRNKRFNHNIEENCKYLNYQFLKK